MGFGCVVFWCRVLFWIGSEFLFLFLFGVSVCCVVVSSQFFFMNPFLFLDTKNPTRVFFVSGVSFSVGLKFNKAIPAIDLFVPNNCF